MGVSHILIAPVSGTGSFKSFQEPVLSYLLKIPFNLCTMDLSFDGFSSFLGSGFFTLFGVETGESEAEASGLGDAVAATLAFAA